VNAIVRLMLMPIIAAASRSWEVARIACRVERTSQVSAISVGTVIKITNSLFHW
jgi:hypothetical protein